MEELTGWPARPLPERNVDEKTDYVGLIFIFVNDIFINNFAYFASRNELKVHLFVVFLIEGAF